MDWTGSAFVANPGNVPLTLLPNSVRRLFVQVAWGTQLQPIDAGWLAQARLEAYDVDPDVFPPIVVGYVTGRPPPPYVRVGGLHRCEMYRQRAHDTVVAEVREYGSEDELWLAALDDNGTHGKPFTAYDRERAFVTAERRGIPAELVARALRSTVGGLERRTLRVLVRDGRRRPEPVAIRRGLRAIADREVTRAQADRAAMYGAGRPVDLLRNLCIVCELEALPPPTAVGLDYARVVVVALADWIERADLAAEGAA